MNCGSSVWIWTRVPEDFCPVYGPPNLWRGSRVQTPGTPVRPPPPHGPGFMHMQKTLPPFLTSNCTPIPVAVHMLCSSLYHSNGDVYDGSWMHDKRDTHGELRMRCVL